MPHFVRKSSIEKIAAITEDNVEGLDKEAFFDFRPRLEKVMDNIVTLFRNKNLDVNLKVTNIKPYKYDKRDETSCILSFNQVPRGGFILTFYQAKKDKQSDIVNISYAYDENYYEHKMLDMLIQKHRCVRTVSSLEGNHGSAYVDIVSSVIKDLINYEDILYAREKGLKDGDLWE